MSNSPHLAASVPTRFVGKCASQATRRTVLFVALSMGLLTGCVDDINSEYGSQVGLGTDSVNGTAVFAEMFEQAGHKVSVTHRLSPRIKEKADVLVWFPDDFKPPSQPVRKWLNTWLCDQPGRTLIYVGRDYDAAVTYWERMQTGAPPAQVPELKVRLARARNHFGSERADMPADEDCDWFTAEGKLNPRSVRALSGEAEWVDGIDGSALGIELNGRFAEGDDAEVLIESKGEPLLTREDVCSSQLFVVTNGSFLLNLPLVNKEHRKLASRLIGKVGTNRRVYFIESGNGGPKILENDSDDTIPSGLVILGIAPFDTILLHLALLGVIFCFARYPLFGRPRIWKVSAPSDFGKHVVALGKLLEAVGDEAYAWACLDNYRRITHSTTKGDGKKR